MVSKIIQKEKELQDGYLEGNDMCLISIMFEHKQHLINLKEYFEEELDFICGLSGFFNTLSGDYWLADERIDKFKEDIQELTKIIERYK